MRAFLFSLVCAGTLVAQTPTPPKAAPCDSAAILLTAEPIYGVGVKTIVAACPAFAQRIAIYAAKHPTLTAAELVSELLHGALPLVPPPAPVVRDSVPPVPQSTPYPNRPAAFTHASEIDFSQAVPSLPDDRDRPIAGTNWNMIYFGGNWTSSAGVWSGRWAPGSYGGGIIGQGNGHGIGNVFTYAPDGTTRLYLSMRVLFDFDASQWHPISNKFVNITGDHSLLLVQLNEGGNWRHAEELGFAGFPTFGVDHNRSVGDVHLAGQIDNRPVPVRQWTQIEVLIDLANHVFKVWQDGVLTTDAAPNFASTKITTVGVNAFRGGGGETLSVALAYRYDHFFLAW